MTATVRPASTLAFFENIKDLCGLLWQRKKEYEQLAAALTDKALSRTILMLAQECHQYACELSAQLQCLGGPAPGEKMQAPRATIDAKSYRNESAVLRFCKRQENKTVRAYRKLLRKAYFHEGVRQMIRYQLEGLRGAVVQLNLLTAVKFH